MQKAIVETLAELEADGTLAPAQRAEVERRLGEALRPPDHGERFVRIVGSLGAVLVAAGVLYLIGYNWEQLGKGVKLALIFGLWGGVHVAGFRLTTSGRWPLLGTAFTVLGVLCFGGAIGLVAQIYHLTSHYPNAMLLWWALNVPVLLWSRTRAVQFAVTALFVVWCFWHVGVSMEDVHWGGVDETVVAFGLLAAGLAVLAGGLGRCVAGTRWSDFGPLWRGLAWAGALVGPFVLAFDGLWDRGSLLDAMQRSERGLWFASRPLHGWLLATLAGAALFAAGASPARGRTAGWQPAIVAGSSLLLGGLAVLAPAAMPLVANVLMLALLVLFVRVGTRTGRPALVNFAVAVFCFVAFVRYVEYLWDKLAGAYAFLGLGVLLLGLGWFLERQRRRWIARSREATA